ncbi:MAG: sigma-54 dependent transcriptional regulator [Gemmatimonadota bacterium]
MAILLLGRDSPELQAALAAAGLGERSEVVADVAVGMERLEQESWELVLIDAALAGGSALELVEPLAAAGRHVVVLAARPTLSLTMRVLRAGARDVLELPPPPDRLRQLVEDAAGAGTVAAPDPAGERRWVGSSPALLEAFRGAHRLAGVDAPLLIWGETGTGKELLARVVHDHSPRAEGPFVTLNCGAIPEAVLVSELFGHERGAVPGAYGRRVGRAAKAGGGSLFLDEVSRLSPRVQAMVVRLITEGTIEAAGAAEPQQVDVRVIAAMDESPAELARDGRLLPDLVYALSAGTLHVPPLRERGESDIRELATYFAGEYAARYEKPASAIADDAWAVLIGHDWPGNVRQLRGAMERAVVEASGSTIHAAHLPGELRRPSHRLQPEHAITLEELEKRHIVRILEITEGHLGRTADLLGIHRNTLRRKLAAYGIAAVQDS